MMKRRAWREEELVVLVAIFSCSSFSMGDDEKPLCRDIAMEFGRTPGTIDRQWRNIKDILNEKNIKKIGARLVFWTNKMLYDKSSLVSLARQYCYQQNWDLTSYL
jgi:hypothetical protein